MTLGIQERPADLQIDRVRQLMQSIREEPSFLQRDRHRQLIHQVRYQRTVHQLLEEVRQVPADLQIERRRQLIQGILRLPQREGLLEHQKVGLICEAVLRHMQVEVPSRGAAAEEERDLQFLMDILPLQLSAEQLTNLGARSVQLLTGLNPRESTSLLLDCGLGRYFRFAINDREADLLANAHDDFPLE